jgi:two-component system, OmpR family, phosphate regulon response regulator PhoB
MSRHTILCIEDEVALRDMLTMVLDRAGFSVCAVANAERAMSVLKTQKFSLLLIDWMLPGRSGLSLVRCLRKQPENRHLPIIMLTAKADEESLLLGLGSGVDDYLSKPFSPKELVARIGSLLRRVETQSSSDDTHELVIDGLRLDLDSYRVFANNTAISLGPKEFQLLRYLMGHPGRVYSRQQLLDQVWGVQAFVEQRTVDVHILRLRKQLAKGGCEGMLQTVRSVGYCLVAQE